MAHQFDSSIEVLRTQDHSLWIGKIGDTEVRQPTPGLTIIGQATNVKNDLVPEWDPAGTYDTAGMCVYDGEYLYILKRWRGKTQDANFQLVPVPVPQPSKDTKQAFWQKVEHIVYLGDTVNGSNFSIGNSHGFKSHQQLFTDRDGNAYWGARAFPAVEFDYVSGDGAETSLFVDPAADVDHDLLNGRVVTGAHVFYVDGVPWEGPPEARWFPSTNRKITFYGFWGDSTAATDPARWNRSDTFYQKTAEPLELPGVVPEDGMTFMYRGNSDITGVDLSGPWMKTGGTETITDGDILYFDGPSNAWVNITSELVVPLDRDAARMFGVHLYPGYASSWGMDLPGDATYDNSAWWSTSSTQLANTLMQVREREERDRAYFSGLNIGGQLSNIYFLNAHDINAHQGITCKADPVTPPHTKRPSVAKVLSDRGKPVKVSEWNGAKEYGWWTPDSAWFAGEVCLFSVHHWGGTVNNEDVEWNGMPRGHNDSILWVATTDIPTGAPDPYNNKAWKPLTLAWRPARIDLTTSVSFDWQGNIEPPNGMMVNGVRTAISPWLTANGPETRFPTNPQHGDLVFTGDRPASPTQLASMANPLQPGAVARQGAAYWWDSSHGWIEIKSASAPADVPTVDDPRVPYRVTDPSIPKNTGWTLSVGTETFRDGDIIGYNPNTKKWENHGGYADGSPTYTGNCWAWSRVLPMDDAVPGKILGWDKLSGPAWIDPPAGGAPGAPGTTPTVTKSNTAGQNPTANPPANPHMGDVYINIPDGRTWIRDATSWVQLPSAAPKKYLARVTLVANTPFTVTHNLNDPGGNGVPAGSGVAVHVYTVAAIGASPARSEVSVDVLPVDANSLRITSSTAGQYDVVVFG